MSFVNEVVPTADIERYGLQEINRIFLKADCSYEWTIDRERDVYLRWMLNDRENSIEHTFSFYWKGAIFTIQLRAKGESARGGSGHTSWTSLKIDGSAEILKSHKEEILSDLKNALREYGEAGLLSSVVEHTAVFEF